MSDELGWISTKDKLHPDKPGEQPYEQIPCLVVYKREVLIRVWNCEHLVWDDEEGDDYFCSAEDVSYWMLLPKPPNDKLSRASSALNETAGGQASALNGGLYMTTTIKKCPTCGGDAIDRSEFWESVTPNGDELNRKIYAIEKAIKKYYLALDNREHGGVALHKAFVEIERILGLNWKQGEMKKFLEEPPKLNDLYV